MIFAHRSVISICCLLCLSFLNLIDRRTEAGEQGQPQRPPISYSRQIKPVLMVHCAGCHGPDNWFGGLPYEHDLDVTTYTGLMRGGTRGADVVPGSPGTSRLQQYIEMGKMPFKGNKLQESELQLVSTWIQEGAKEDHDEPPSIHVVLENVPLVQRKAKGPTYPYERILCRIPVESYATIIISDPVNGKILSKKGGAVSREPEMGSAASVKMMSPPYSDSRQLWLDWSLDELLYDVERGTELPHVVSIELVIEDFKEVPWGAEFGVTRDIPGARYIPRRNSMFLPQPISIEHSHSGQFHYTLEGDADVDIEIVALEHQRNPPVYEDRQSDLKAGEKTYPWNLKDNQGKLVVPGGYVARFRSKTRNTNIPVNDVCVVFHVLP